MKLFLKNVITSLKGILLILAFSIFIIKSQKSSRRCSISLIPINQTPLNNSSKAFSSSQPWFISAFSTCPLVKPISASFAILASLIFGEAYFWTHSCAWLLNALRSFLYYEATTASWGSSGSGAQSKAWRDSKAVLTVRAGDHSPSFYFKISRQIAPVCEEMFGCHIFVSNFILGGL